MSETNNVTFSNCIIQHKHDTTDAFNDPSVTKAPAKGEFLLYMDVDTDKDPDIRGNYYKTTLKIGDGSHLPAELLPFTSDSDLDALSTRVDNLEDQVNTAVERVVAVSNSNHNDYGYLTWKRIGKETWESRQEIVDKTARATADTALDYASNVVTDVYMSGNKLVKKVREDNTITPEDITTIVDVETFKNRAEGDVRNVRIKDDGNLYVYKRGVDDEVDTESEPVPVIDKTARDDIKTLNTSVYGSGDGATDGLIGRTDILESQVSALSSATRFIGTSDRLPDNGKDGDIVIVGNKEYVYDSKATTGANGTKWVELGDTTALSAAVSKAVEKVSAVSNPDSEDYGRLTWKLIGKETWEQSSEIVDKTARGDAAKAQKRADDAYNRNDSNYAFIETIQKTLYGEDGNSGLSKDAITKIEIDDGELKVTNGNGTGGGLTIVDKTAQDKADTAQSTATNNKLISVSSADNVTIKDGDNNVQVSQFKLKYNNKTKDEQGNEINEEVNTENEIVDRRYRNIVDNQVTPRIDKLETCKITKGAGSRSIIGNNIEVITDSGDHCEAGGPDSSAFGWNTKAWGKQAFATGCNSSAVGEACHAEGFGTQAGHQYSQEEIDNGAGALGAKKGQVIGHHSHTEGQHTKAFGQSSHAEGNSTETGSRHPKTGVVTPGTGTYAHAEGQYTRAIGKASHAEGSATEARFDFSHTEGEGTVATADCQHVEGKYNRGTEDEKDKVHILGGGWQETNTDGTKTNHRRTIHDIDREGNARYAGSITLGMDPATGNEGVELTKETLEKINNILTKDLSQGEF